MRRARGLLALLAAGAAVALAVWRAGAPEAVPVRLVAVGRGPVEATAANTRAGSVRACRRARLSPSVGGQIARLAVREGDRVARGALLLELWNRDLAARRALAAARARAARARAQEACTAARVARREAERLVRLHRRGLASEEARDRAVGEAEAREAGCRAAEAGVAVARAELAVAEADLARTRLTAPFAGVVAEVNGEVGEYITPSPLGVATPPAVDLIDPSCVYVSAPIDEVDAAGVRPGMEARISLDAYRGRTFAGRVRRVAAYVREREKQARTVDVEADFVGDPGVVLLPGYSADLEIVLEARANVLRVPTEALQEGPRVLVYDEASGRLEARRVRTGIGNWRWTEVLSGLRAGERVVVSLDREGVRPGARAVPEGDGRGE